MHFWQPGISGRALAAPSALSGLTPHPILTFTQSFQLTAFGGLLKYTVSYNIPVEAVEGDLMSHADVILKVTALAFLDYGAEGLWG